MRKIAFWSPESRRSISLGESGQAIVEYMMTLLVVVTVVAVLGIGFRKTLYSIWQTFAQEISAGCPGCPPDPSIRLH